MRIGSQCQRATWTEVGFRIADQFPATGTDGRIDELSKAANKVGEHAIEEPSGPARRDRTPSQPTRHAGSP